MAAYRDLLTQLLAEANDEEMLSFTESFFLSLCEVCVNIIQLQFKPLTSIESVVFPIPGIFATGYIPIVDLNLLQRTSDNSNLDNLMLLTIVRDSAAKEWLKNSGDLINYFSDGWSATGTPTEYYLIFSNLMGVRKSPTVDPTPSLTYVQYIEVIDIDSTIPFEDSFMPLMMNLLHAFLFARISQFDLAEAELRRFTALAGERNDGR